MPLAFPEDKDLCLPIQIVDGRSNGGALFGGRPPSGVIPIANGLRFFASFPFFSAPETCLSLFVADFDEILELRGRVVELDRLEVLVHSPTSRADSASPHDSNLSEHSLALQSVCEDWVLGDEGEKVVRSGHKLGGSPYLINPRSSLVSELRKTYSEGFRHVAQFDFPSGDDSMVSGDWPFGDGIFSLFGKDPFMAPADWRWLWDF